MTQFTSLSYRYYYRSAYLYRTGLIGYARGQAVIKPGSLNYTV